MKLIKQLKLLTLQLIISLILLNTQLSFAQSKFDGSYIGANLGVVQGSADSKDLISYNSGDNGSYKPNGNIFGLYGGYNISFNKEYFIGFEAGLNRLVHYFALVETTSAPIFFHSSRPYPLI